MNDQSLLAIELYSAPTIRQMTDSWRIKGVLIIMITIIIHRSS